ncbi:MAG: retron system putative HNH endonuclease, partial [Cyanobacteriota bacterium]|nr:retron system putative HNH endonuclease [Cyanobacteriota bacterium]
MKYIQKQAEPLELIQFKNQINDNWKPNYADLYKPPIKQALMQEQGFICCYCEQRLDPEDCHIEHFQPQSDPSVDPLDFSNMLCSCQNQMQKGEPRHCG